MLFGLSKQMAPQCPDCDIEMHFLSSQRNKRVFVSTILERTLFLCPNCGRLGHRFVLIPQLEEHKIHDTQRDRLVAMREDF